VKILDVPQGSTAWKIARLGMPTASQFHRIMSPKTLKPLAGAETYLNELLAEWALGIMEGEDNDFMERGRELEADAVAWFELATGVECETVGFITNDAGTVGCSPDRLIGSDAGLEIKCPKATTHIGYLRTAGDVGPYLAQLQGALWVAERQRWTWVSYHPTLPAAVVTVERDEKFIAALASAVTDFADQLAAAKADLLRRGVVPVTPEDAPSGAALSEALLSGNLLT